MAEIRLDNVFKRYGEAYAVDHVSLTIGHGEFVALVGPSGCGKTTTLNLIAGLLEQSGGDIWIGDKLVNDLDPKDRDIAMVFQNYALYPNKTVRRNLGFPLKMRKLPARQAHAKVMEAARVLDIVHLLDRYPRELSGGQQQRGARGRAMVRDPRAFLMDEPLSNLDAKLRVQMRSELKRFHQEQGATMVYVTHDQLEAMTMADRMAVMRAGVLQQYDKPTRVYEAPVNTFVAGFVGSPAMNLLPGKLATREGAIVVQGEGWHFPLPPAAARRVDRTTTPSVVLGARPGAVAVHTGPVPGSVRGQVYTVEPTGDVTFAFIRLGDATVVASVGAHVPIAPDDIVWLLFDPAKLHLFDGGTGLALPEV